MAVSGHAGGFTLSSPSQVQAFPDSAPASSRSSGRAYVLKAPEARPATFREINAERDRRFKEHAKSVSNALQSVKKRVRAAACHCDISRRTPHDNAPSVSPFRKSVRAVAFKRGMLIKGKPAPKNAGGGKRSEVTEFSTRSRVRCAWSFLNAETDWLAMVTLTYPVHPDVEHCRAHLRRWLKRVNRSFPGVIDVGWCIEATKEGRPHFHVFFGSGGTMGKAISRERCERITRKGKQYRIMRGKVESACVKAWLEILDNASLMGDRDATEAFQWGGICERLNSPDAAARYVSKEASKRVQKQGVSLGKGCFWRLSRHLKGKPRFITSLSKKGREVLPSFSRIFDRAAVESLCDFEEFEQLDESTTEQDLQERFKNKLAEKAVERTFEERCQIERSKKERRSTLPPITEYDGHILGGGWRQQEREAREWARMNPREKVTPEWQRDFL